MKSLKISIMAASSLACATSSGGMDLVLIAGAVMVVPIIFTSSVQAATPKRDAYGLLSDIRSSLALMATSYKDGSPPQHRSAVSILTGVTQATKATQRLEDALSMQDAKAISRATAALSAAIGDLQTRYALSPARNRKASQGLSVLNECWKAYTARYVLVSAPKGAKAVSRKEMQILETRVGELSKRVSSLENEVAGNTALRSEVTRIRTALATYDTRSYEYATYQSALLTLTFISGSFDALVSTSKVYFPAYHVYIDSFSDETERWNHYWNGYYDGYYSGRSGDWYDQQTAVNISTVDMQQISNYSTTNYQTIYNITQETNNVYEALPAEDFSQVYISPPGRGTQLNARVFDEIAEKEQAFSAAISAPDIDETERRRNEAGNSSQEIIEQMKTRPLSDSKSIGLGDSDPSSHPDENGRINDDSRKHSLPFEAGDEVRWHTEGDEAEPIVRGNDRRTRKDVEAKPAEAHSRQPVAHNNEETTEPSDEDAYPNTNQSSRNDETTNCNNDAEACDK